MKETFPLGSTPRIWPIIECCKVIYELTWWRILRLFTPFVDQSFLGMKAQRLGSLKRRVDGFVQRCLLNGKARYVAPLGNGHIPLPQQWNSGWHQREGKNKAAGNKTQKARFGCLTPLLEQRRLETWFNNIHV